MTIAMYVFAFIVAVFAVGRITRLVTYDSYPPVQWVRNKWDAKTGESGWNELLHCPYCFAPWVALFIVPSFAVGLFGWDIFTTFLGWWWVGCSTLAVAYVAASFVASDLG
jgi:hypothetical protein